MLSRERLIEIAVAVASVGFMIGMLVVVGRTHGTTENAHQVLTPEGGVLVVYGIAAFVLVMALAGLVLIRTVTEPEARPDGNGA